MTTPGAQLRAAWSEKAIVNPGGTQQGLLLDRWQSRLELYELLGYNDWEARDRAYFTAHSEPEKRSS